MGSRMHTLKIALALTALWMGGSIAAHAETLVVVAQQSPVTTLTRTQLLNIFMGRPNQLADGKRAVPVDQVEGHPLRDTFYREVLGKSNAEIKAHWSKVVFTGRGQPPKQFASDAEVKQFLARNIDAIGYIDARNRSGDLKVVSVTP